MSERLTRFEGFRESARARMTDALAQELTVLWNRATAAGVEPERMAAALETWRGRIQRVARGKVGGAATFVSRTAELGQLVDLARQAGSGQAATAIIAGEAGVGKTRLITEFTERARHDLNAHVLSGSCVKLGDGVVPYAPLVESLRALLWEQGPETVRQAAGPAWNDLADLVSDGADRATPAGPDVGVPGRMRIFSAVRRMLERLGTTAPVVLVFEDLHWADQSTLDLVSYLTRTMAGERTLLACSHRSALPAGHRLRRMLAEPGFGPRVTSMELPRFTEAELSLFLDEFAPLDRDAARRYHEVSDGNVFFAEQLAVSGVLSGSADSVEEPVPRSVEELVLARVSGLSTAARRVLRVASAARRADDRLLEAVSGLESDVLDEALNECQDQGMLVLDAVEGRYVVPHALLGAAVYKAMAPRERRRLHGEVAQALAAGAGGAFARDWGVVVELAHHWYRARRYPEALVAAVRAGETTMRVRGFHEAASHYRRALILWDQVAEPEEAARCSREQILLALADAARWAGHVGQAVAHVQEAVDAAGPHANPRRLGELYERLGSYQREARLVREAREAPEDGHAYAEAVRLLAQAAPGEAVYARALSGLAMAEVRAGAYDMALDRAQEAVVLAHDCGDAGAENRALNAAGVALAVSGRTAESEPVLRRALDVADRADRLEDVLRTYSNLARALAFAGDTAGSADQARAGLRRAQALGLAGTRLGGALAGNAGSSLMLLGHWNEATDLLNEALADRPHAENSARLRLTLAGIEVERGRFADAERLIDELRGQQQSSDPWLTAALHACEAELWCWRGQPVRAYGTAFQGLETTDNALMRLRLCAVGLRAAADHRLRRSGGVLVAGADLVDLATEEAATLPETAVVQLLRRQCEAEDRRASRADSAEDWAAVAAGWDGVERPYPAAYARWRQAGAAARDGVAGAAATAIQATEAAGRLGAEPLRAEAARLVARLGGDAAGRHTSGDIAGGEGAGGSSGAAGSASSAGGGTASGGSARGGAPGSMVADSGAAGGGAADSAGSAGGGTASGGSARGGAPGSMVADSGAAGGGAADSASSTGRGSDNTGAANSGAAGSASSASSGVPSSSAAGSGVTSGVAAHDGAAGSASSGSSGVPSSRAADSGAAGSGVTGGVAASGGAPGGTGAGGSTANTAAARGVAAGDRAAGSAAASAGSRAAAGGSAVPAVVPELGIVALTPREADVLRLLATGCSNREIGSRFRLAEGTVATHVHRIMRKLGVQNRTEAALWAVRNGLGAGGE
ncbi:ATP/maltotriose-dependent transcriptional regulator MalT [Catenulispora sp. GAS73]|uniref:helix-turn-helix transcriptional regulator n=1 Tax=Catenulispora sp. GAS73 TaxID=3156269 RepID=UPI0035142BD8